ncbi:hypothetical protein SHANETTE_187 [Bacillus phage Shanette]|uniref:Uncharacterized protein n=1 Tax=Bacillus phage Shanette TaxID=1296656 RepID=S5M589_9CAUD|nr:hypothetical protein AVV46_gp110 [Bacillus phage Shanette]AGR47081.1 hypothetical protein SHANETTE_187 [Bacillus phage Shanette]
MVMSGFKVIWNSSTPIGTPRKSEGKCQLCEGDINNYQNHYKSNDKDIRICLTCVMSLSDSYEGIFNNNHPKGDTLN